MNKALSTVGIHRHEDQGTKEHGGSLERTVTLAFAGAAEK